jgi:hypothetical protein
MIGNIIGIPLSLITIKVIRDYSKMETLLFSNNNDKIEENIDTSL